MSTFEVTVRFRDDARSEWSATSAAHTAAMGSSSGPAMGSIPGPAMGSIPGPAMGSVGGPAMSSLPPITGSPTARPAGELSPLSGR